MTEMLDHLNHTEIFEAVLETLDEGIAVLDTDLRVLFWNRAAAALTGYLAADLLARTLPAGAYQIVPEHPAGLTGPAGLAASASQQAMEISGPTRRPLLVQLRHRQGHTLPAMLRRTALRDGLGKRFGTLLRFHPVEGVDALPHGEMNEDAFLEQHVERSQAAMEDRLDTAWREWADDGVPFGLLWINVDQAAALRRTHGHEASEAMLGIVERTLLHALRPTEMLGRWGTHEFLVLCHERTPKLLEAQARHVCELARSADFRWWGDRVPLTVSIGAAQAELHERLGGLLQRAQMAMESCGRSGGNQVKILELTTGNGGQQCSQS